MHIKANLSNFATSLLNVYIEQNQIYLNFIVNLWKLSNACTQHRILTHFGNNNGLRFTLSLQYLSSYTDQCVFAAAILNCFSNRSV